MANGTKSEGKDTVIHEMDLIKQEVLKRITDAHDIDVELSVDRFLNGNVYYTEFESEQTGEPFYYAFVDHNGTHLYNDGVELVKALHLIMERRRNIWQRMSDFQLGDLIGAGIAFFVTLVFVYSAIFSSISQELLAVFSIIVGYYFGKTIQKT